MAKAKMVEIEARQWRRVEKAAEAASKALVRLSEAVSRGTDERARKAVEGLGIKLEVLFEEMGEAVPAIEAGASRGMAEKV